MSSILIVDDRPTNRQLLRELLSFRDHEILEAGDGEEALELVRSKRPSLVVTDILMPRMDGYKFTQSLRADPDIADTPVIFYTATYRAGDARALARSCGVRFVLPKPSDPALIVAAVNSELGITEPMPDPMVAASSINERAAAISRASLDQSASHRHSVNIASLQRVSSRLAALIEIAIEGSAERDPARIVQYWFNASCRIIESAYAAIAIIDDRDGTLQHVVTKGFSPEVYQGAQGSCRGHVSDLIDRRRGIRATASRVGEALAGFPDGHPAVHSLLGLPIVGRDQVYGWIYFANPSGAAEFTDEDDRIAATLATELAVFYENAVLYDRVQRHAAQLQIEMAERRKAEAETRRRDQQLAHSQRLEGIGKLTGGVAHDFNNLLAAIIGNLDLLLERLGNDPVGHDMARSALEASLQGAVLTREMLAFSRRQTLEPRTIDLNRCVTQVLNMLKRTLGSDIEIKMELSSNAGMIHIDPTQLETSILNLAINARDAMQNGGTLTVKTVRQRIDEKLLASSPELRPGRYAALLFSDTGCGMSPEVMERAFEPFFTTKEVGKGTGLGLSSVFGFVKQSEGHISVESQPGHGTTFKLLFPITEEVEQVPAAETAVRAALPRGSESIMIVDDNDLVLRVVSVQLKELGYKLVTAASGPEALRLIQEGAAPDMLLTDVVMPAGMSGVMLAKSVRELRPGLKILFMSGFADKALDEQTLAGLQAQLLTKPFRRQDIALKLRELFDERP